jgi:hypothetical protein
MIRKRTIFHRLPEAAKLVSTVAIAVFILMEYYPPYAQSTPPNDRLDGKREFLSSFPSSSDFNAQEVLNLAKLIRLINDNQLSESKVLRYAGLIYHASQKYRVSPLEIIAIIMAESRFKENSLNAKTGDYGLGQINWEHWGKPYGLTPQDLLDPAINIYLTCHIYKFFGEDFGKYHRGNGIKSKAYILNVKSILSTLHAFAELNKNNIS